MNPDLIALNMKSFEGRIASSKNPILWLHFSCVARYFCMHVVHGRKHGAVFHKTAKCISALWHRNESTATAVHMHQGIVAGPPAPWFFHAMLALCVVKYFMDTTPIGWTTTAHGSILLPILLSPPLPSAVSIQHFDGWFPSSWPMENKNLSSRTRVLRSHLSPSSK